MLNKFGFSAAAAMTPVLAYSLYVSSSRGDQSSNPEALARQAALLSKTQEAESRLPSLLVGQQSSVIRVPSFLSTNDIDEILAFADSKEVNSRCGTKTRDKDGLSKTQNDHTWCTTYLHTDHTMQRLFPSKLLGRLEDLARETDKKHWNFMSKCSSDSIFARTIEIHEATRGGGLPQKTHFDGGSLVTVDLMLSDPDKGDFEGGTFMTLESDGELKKHDFKKGDAIVFLSHKYHCVDVIKKGRRRVMVVEFWEGDERQCAHRCTTRFGDCSYNLASQKMDVLMQVTGDDI